MNMPATTSAQRMIPLNLLQVSPGNVRKTGGVSVYRLADSILAHGLLQNLVVKPAGDRFEVDAGGRRFAAMQELLKDGKIPADYLVACLVLGEGVSAHEASLAENVAREAMHPADEAEAFRVLAEEGHDAGHIAERFGTTEKHIKQRLKLANVSPAIIAEFKAGKAKLEQVQVLALVDDHAAQERAWGKKDGHHREPRVLRETLTKAEVASSSPLGKFVGTDAYENAGGPVRRDIFGLAGDAWMEDVELVRRLALEKLQKKADELAGKGWAWIEVRLSVDYGDLSEFKQTHSDKPADYAGVIVAIDRWDGKVEYHKGLVKPGTKMPSGETTKGKPGRKAKKPGTLAFSQEQRLQGERTAILRHQLADQPRIALAALAAALYARFKRAPGDYDTDRKADCVVQITQRDQNIPPVAREPMKAAPAAKAVDALSRAWADKLKPAGGKIFAWLLTQPVETTHELLTFLASIAIDTTMSFERANDAGAEFAAIAGVDFGKHWSVTEAWLRMQPRGFMVAAVTEACGAVAATPIAKAKAPEAARLAAPLLADAGWLPKSLRGPTYGAKAKGPATSPAKAASKSRKVVAKKALPGAAVKKPAGKKAASSTKAAKKATSKNPAAKPAAKR